MSSAAEAELGALFINAKNRSFNAPNAHGTWPPTTTYTNANQQRNGTHTTHQQDITKNTKSHGYALPLAKMPERTGPILLLLETRHTELGRLLHQASPNQPPQICPPHKTNTCQRSQIHKTLRDYNNTSNIRTTNQNIGINNFFVTNLPQTPGFKTKTINTVTAKSA
jgi:hypothetical protein